ncbi:MAG: hypothetical protein ACLUEQ_11790 [Cloacibacillus evryensis]
MANAPMKLLAEWSFEPAKIHHGYSKRLFTSASATRTAIINLNSAPSPRI